MRFLKMMVLLAAIALPCSAAAQEPRWMDFLFDCPANTACVIKENGGGIVFFYQEAAKEALEENLQIQIQGECYSACVVFASMARKNVCVAQGAKIGLHHGTERHVYTPFGTELEIRDQKSLDLYMAPPPGYRVEYVYVVVDYGNDINEWAFRENKMPYGSDLYVMTYAEALKFWRPCTADELKK